MPIFINGIEVPYFKFPGGELQVNIIEIKPYKEGSYNFKIKASLLTSDDIMLLILSVIALREQWPKSTMRLCIPYFPYSRQDRVCNIGEAPSLRVMCSLINALMVEMVHIYDPHSHVLLASLNNVFAWSMKEIIMSSGMSNLMGDYMLVSPDAGAEKKVLEVSSVNRNEVIFCRKVRNASTGNITDCEFYRDVNNKRLLILDDICDGGATFIALAQKLKEGGAREINLYVTNGIFSRGIDELAKYFTKIYCAFNLFGAQHPILHTLKGLHNDY